MWEVLQDTEGFETLDAKLRAALSEILPLSLTQRWTVRTEMNARADLRIRGQQLRHVILWQFRADASMGARFSYEDLMNIRIDGGKTMEVHARWDVALLSCTDELPDRLKRYL